MDMGTFKVVGAASLLGGDKERRGFVAYCDGIDHIDILSDDGVRLTFDEPIDFFGTMVRGATFSAVNGLVHMGHGAQSDLLHVVKEDLPKLHTAYVLWMKRDPSIGCVSHVE